ncbi:MAG: helix-turn-helix transcriptional regulator [Verrucomicrobia bacterium]|nr:helix-turn-helix transcriptional regulator [Verrucomicrobiota bacterium]
MAYRQDLSDDDWVAAVLTATRDCFEMPTVGAAGYIVDGTIDVATGCRIPRTFRALTTLGDVHRIGSARQFLDLCRQTPATAQQAVWFSGTVATLASAHLEMLPGAAPGDLRRSPIWQASWSDAVADAVTLLGHDGGLGTMGVVLATPGTSALPARERKLWSRVMAHVGAALRVRRDRDRRVDAVLSRRGHVEHTALRRQQLANLRSGYAAHESARHLRASPERALELWQGLCDGQWSLLDSIDRDGKAFVLAVRNSPGSEVGLPTTHRQRAALALASLGYGNKQIGYALGLREGAVAMLLRRAKASLGVRSRTDLVRAFKRGLIGKESP